MTRQAKPRSPRRARQLTRRRALQAAGIAAGAVATHRAVGAAAKKPARPATSPNVLLIMTDQQHIDTISAAGCKHLRTPALDALAREGVTFRQSYCAYPLCSPDRSAMLTGRMPNEAGVPVNGRPIHKSVPNLGQWFAREATHERVYVGKWHLPGSFTHDVPGFRVLTPGVGGQGNLGDTSTALACEGYLRNRSKDRPFLMVASFFQPHDICQWLRLNQHDPGELRYPGLADELPPLPANFHATFPEPPSVLRKRAGDEPGKADGGWSERHWRYYRYCYYRHIEMVDAEIGRVLDALRDTGQDRDTLVIFTSDHGEGIGHHRMVRKSSFYDEASKVPMIVSAPGRGRVDVIDADHLVSAVDVVPTICDYAGVPAPPEMRGRSLRAWVEGDNAPDRAFVAGEMFRGGVPGRMIRSPRYKYIVFRGEKPEMLFDMAADPGETKNLASEADHASALADHRRMLAEWERGLTPAPSTPKSARWA